MWRDDAWLLDMLNLPEKLWNTPTASVKINL
jgi:hypothetical protein